MIPCLASYEYVVSPPCIFHRSNALHDGTYGKVAVGRTQLAEVLVGLAEHNFVHLDFSAIAEPDGEVGVVVRAARVHDEESATDSRLSVKAVRCKVEPRRGACACCELCDV